MLGAAGDVSRDGRDEENRAGGGFFGRRRDASPGKGFVVASDHIVGAGLGDEEGAGEIDGKGRVEVCVPCAEEGLVGDDAGIDVDVDGAKSFLDLGYRLGDLVA